MDENVQIIHKDTNEKKQCTFLDRYTDMKVNRHEHFTCCETAVCDGLCIFHSPDYWKTHREEVTSKIQNKIVKASEVQDKDKDTYRLYFIGYNIPSILIEKPFPVDTYFTHAKFHETVRFARITFKNVDFSRCEFHSKAFFENIKCVGGIFFASADFKSRVFFDEVTFASCNFSQTIFNNTVLFKNTKFFSILENPNIKSDFSHLKLNNKGEMHFTNCSFDNTVDFSASSFINPIIFSNVFFRKELVFRNSHFSNKGTVYFNNATCFNGLTFSHAKFEGDTPAFFTTCIVRNVHFSSCDFGKGVSFDSTRFIGLVDFSYCKFCEDVFYTNTIFFGEVRFLGSEFSEEAIATFKDIEFHSNVNLSYSTFDTEVFFYNTKFFDKSDFSNIESGDISVFNFENCSFNKQVNFSESIFGGNVLLKETVFKDDVIFDKTVFKKTISFESTRFDNNNMLNNDDIISFNSTHFHGATNFSGTTFTRKVIFQNARFEDYSTGRFEDITFDKLADFSNVHSMKGAIISFHAKFRGESKFNYAEFNEEVRFEKCHFEMPSEFNFAQFEEVSFRAVTFKKAFFKGASFYTVVFHNVTFAEPVDFAYAIFKKAIFAGGSFESQANFRFVTFEEGDKVVFDIDDLHNVSFSNSDITRIHFSENVVWSENELKKFEVFDERNFEKSVQYKKCLEDIFNECRIEPSLSQIAPDARSYIKYSCDGIEIHIDIEQSEDEDKLKAKVKSDNDSKLHEFLIRKLDNEVKVISADGTGLGSVRSVYRNLRENHEYWLKHEEGDEFYIREMEMRRNYREIHSKSSIYSKKNSFLRRIFSPTALYRWVSNYGLDYKVPAIIGGVALFIIPTLFSLYINSHALSFGFSNETVSNISKLVLNSTAYTLNVSEKELGGHLTRIIVFSIIGALFLSALKYSFTRKSRK